MKVCRGFFSVCSSIMQPDSVISVYHCRIGYSIPQGSSAVGKSLSETFFDQGDHFQHYALLKRLYRLCRSVLFLICSGWFPPWIEVTLASSIWMQMFGMSLSFTNLMWGETATRVYAREYNAEFCMDGGCNPGQSSFSSEPAYHQSRV